MKCIFIGTCEFGLPALRALEREHQVVQVVTQPDRPAGRGMKERPPPVKKEALRLDLPIYQPEDINAEESLEKIGERGAEAFLVVAYGQILSGALLDLVEWPLNIHGSLLPKYRGAAPINWAIIRGEEKTGVTTMVMDEGMDTGPILLQKETPIGPQDTAGELHDRLARLGREAVLETLAGLEEGELEPRPQPEGGTMAPKLSKEDGLIDWGRPAKEIHDKIRGMNPWPVAFTYYEGERVKLYLSENLGENETETGVRPGTVLGIRPPGLRIKCGGNTSLRLLKLQPPSKRKMSGQDFVNGYHVREGDRFGKD